MYRRFLFGWLAFVTMGSLLTSPSSTQAAEAYLIADNQTGHILASKNANKKLQVASLTKVATAVVVLDWANSTKAHLDNLIIVPASAIQTNGINPVGLQAGDQISIRDLLYCALMASDNTAATVLAHYVGSQMSNGESASPVRRFVASMNALAAQLRMKNTYFVNPHGLDNIEGRLPYSSAADLARLTQYAYTKPSFTFFVSQKKREIHVVRNSATYPATLINTNELLGKDKIDGVKTGKTSRAGECIILSSDRPPEVAQQGTTTYVTPKRLIVVVLDSPSRFEEGLTLINQGWVRYNTWASQGRKISKHQSL